MICVIEDIIVLRFVR